jgi:hypothetical protein
MDGTPAAAAATTGKKPRVGGEKRGRRWVTEEK